MLLLTRTYTSGILTCKNKVSKFLTYREEFAELHGLKWKPSKDQMLTRGNSRKEKTFAHSKGAITVTKTITVLGEILTNDPNFSLPQIRNVVTAMKAATQAYQWTTWSELAPNTKIIKMIFNSLVMSIPKAKLVLTDIPNIHWAKIATFKGSAARNIIGVHQRASIIPALAELEWHTTETDVKTAKLLFAGRLFREKGAIHTANLVKTRRKHIENGDRRGFLGQVHKILSDWDIHYMWKQGPTMKETEWKRLVKKAARDTSIREWDVWRGKPENKHFSQKQWGIEPYVETLGKKERSRLGALRMKTTNARADKIFDDQTANCRLCHALVLETSAHLVADCPALDAERNSYLALNTIKKPPHLWDILEDIANHNNYLTEVQETFLLFTDEHLIPFIPNQVSFTPESVILELEKTAKWISELEPDKS